jgi:hypothetical protein
MMIAGIHCITQDAKLWISVAYMDFTMHRCKAKFSRISKGFEGADFIPRMVSRSDITTMRSKYEAVLDETYPTVVDGL